MLKKRVITALWGIPVVTAAIWYDKPLPWFTGLVAIGGVLAIAEFHRLAASSRVPSLSYFGLIWTLLFILGRDSDLLAIIQPYFDPDLLTPLLMTSLILLSLAWLPLSPKKEKAFAGWAWMLGGTLYAGWLLSYLVALRGLNDGTNWVFFALFTTFASDTAAFFVGRAIGKHRLAPKISPNKTWEGAIAGAIAAMSISLLFLLPTPFLVQLNWTRTILLGLAVSIFGQLGDLAESLLKRTTGVKDSGKLLPGHGGILDRIDSVVFAGVVVYYYVIWAAP